MRWHRLPSPEHKEGDIRVVRKFLLLPRRLKGEWRWLEWAGIRQVRRLIHGRSDGLMPPTT